MTSYIYMFRALCRDLGLKLRRNPSLLELGLLRKKVLSYAEDQTNKRYDTHRDICEYWHSLGSGFTLNLEEPAHFTTLYQISSFGLKVEKDPTEAQELDYLSSFVTNEDKNKHYRPDCSSNILRIMRYLLRTTRPYLDLSSSNVQRFMRHGPGATYEGLDCAEKDYGLWCYSRYRTLDRYLGEGWECSSLEVPDSMSHSYERVGMRQNITARLALVPKDYRGPRGVFISPVAAIYAQLGQDGAIKDFVSNSWMKQCWNPKSQAPSQEVSHVGSFNKSWATLDLKDASDSVTLALIRYLFARTDYVALASTRPSLVQFPNGDCTRLSMLSPMGDGKTFSVLSLVCILVSVASVLDGRGTIAARPPTEEDIRDAAGCVRVFGDDIAVVSEYYDAVCRGLAACGLTVNVSKSFVNGYFREACGYDAYKGVCVTPLRLKVNVDKNRLCEEEVDALVDFHNRCLFLYPQLSTVAMHVEQRLAKFCEVPWTSNFVREPTLLWHPSRLFVQHMNSRSGMIVNDVQNVSVCYRRWKADPARVSDPHNDWYRYNVMLRKLDLPNGRFDVEEPGPLTGPGSQMDLTGVDFCNATVPSVLAETARYLARKPFIRDLSLREPSSAPNGVDQPISKSTSKVVSDLYGRAASGSFATGWHVGI